MLGLSLELGVTRFKLAATTLEQIWVFQVGSLNAKRFNVVAGD
jgi:hypothetical protein